MLVEYFYGGFSWCLVYYCICSLIVFVFRLGNVRGGGLESSLEGFLVKREDYLNY